MAEYTPTTYTVGEEVTTTLLNKGELGIQAAQKTATEGKTEAVSAKALAASGKTLAEEAYSRASGGEESITPEQYKAKGDTKVLAGGKMTAGSKILTFGAGESHFTAEDVGKTICVVEAVSAEAWNKEKSKKVFWQTLSTTIKTYKSAIEVELTLGASKTVTTAVVVYGTDNTKAFEEACTAVTNAGGGIIQLKEGANYGLNPKTGLNIPANTIMEGYGATLTAFVSNAAKEPYAEAKAHENEYSGGFAVSGTSGVGYVAMLGVTSGIVRFKGITFWKTPTSEKISGISIGTSIEEVSFEDCRWKNGFAYAMEPSVPCRVVVDRCEVEGVKSKTVNPFGSMGILFDCVNEGAELIVTDTYFHGNGLEECIHNHCMYIYAKVAYDIKGCTFNKHGNGRYIMCLSEGVSGYVTTVAPFSQVDNCVFGSSIENTVPAICTNTYNSTTYTNCSFNMSSYAIQLEGESSFVNCNFEKGSAAGYMVGVGEYGVGTAGSPANSGQAIVTAAFTNCRFKVTNSSNTVFEAKTAGEITTFNLKLIGCEFRGAPKESHVQCYPHDSGDVVRVEAIGTGFAGETGKGTTGMQAQTAAGAKTYFVCIGCRFDSNLAYGLLKNGGLIDATVMGCKFDVESAAFENTPFEFLHASQNYGSTAPGLEGMFGTYGVTQPKTTGTTTGFVIKGYAATEAGLKKVIEESTFTGGKGSTAYTLSDVVLALKQLGAMKE